MKIISTIVNILVLVNIAFSQKIDLTNLSIFVNQKQYEKDAYRNFVRTWSMCGSP